VNPSKDAFIDWIGHRKIEGRCLLSRWESNSSLKETNMSMTKETTLGCRFVVVWITVRKLPIIWLLWWRRSPWCGQPITVVWFLWLFFVFFFFFLKFSKFYYFFLWSADFPIHFRIFLHWPIEEYSHLLMGQLSSLMIEWVHGDFCTPRIIFNIFIKSLTILTDWFGFSVSSWSGN